MSTIDGLNSQYVERLKVINTLKLFSDSLKTERKESSSTSDAISRIVSVLEDLAEEVKCEKYTFLSDAILLGKKYINCLLAINAYKTAMLKMENGRARMPVEEMRRVNEAQNSYDIEKTSFQNKHGVLPDSADALVRLFEQGIDNAISLERKEIGQLQDEARSISRQKSSVALRSSDPIGKQDSLPDRFLVARCPVKQELLALLRDIGASYSYQSIVLDLRNRGNVIVSSDFKSMSDENIDKFVIAYIFRFIEVFPLGSVNVHIFDQNTNYLYKRLTNVFQNENTGEGVKKTIQIHSTYSDLATFEDVVCEDIFKKTSVDKPDLYSIYESDASDPFNLIILRDGLVDGSGYASPDVLDRVDSLTKPGNTGHKCGLRFLIVDNSGSFVNSLTETNKHLVNSIHGNCELQLEYANGNFSLNDKKTDVLEIQESIDKYVEERANSIAKAIGNREKDYISLDDIAAVSTEDSIGSIMRIPVGKSGDSTVEIPLSCKDEDGTVAGQCIGYMVIGQSGSGKSSFFHSVVLNGCMKYSPRDLQFWLLDFKNGGASSKYRESGIPHIRIIAENNKIDDALCLFQMVLEEMERRNEIFNKYDLDNIIEYNIKADKEGLEHFPRIIIAIDEIQEIFRDDNASLINEKLSSISPRMRSTGMHFVMIAQNLCEGKSYMLREAFFPSASGRICFRVLPDIPRDSGFDEAFVDRKQEITELKTGEAYVSYGNDTIKKVKMAFISPKDMNERYFAMICDRHSEYANMRPLIIGSKKRLAVTDAIQGGAIRFSEAFSAIKKRNGVYSAVIGEDVYRMRPLSIMFSQNENSSVLFLGSDKAIASSLCTSTAISLMRQNVKVHLFNGDRTRLQEGNESWQHPFMCLCQFAAESGGNLENHRLDQLKDLMRNLYEEYHNRQALVQKAEFEDPVFEPIFLIINDLFGIEGFTNNEMIENSIASNQAERADDNGYAYTDLPFGYSIDSSDMGSPKKETGYFRETIQKIMSDILKNGYRYNMHVVLAIKGDPSIWRNAHVSSGVNSIVLFNDTEYADQIENAYYLKEMLKNISNDGGEETMAVWFGKKTFSKLRPIIYKMSAASEKEAIDRLVKGESV